MSKLRHPVRAIREPFGKAGLTVAILALVLAMVGGAYAAGKLTSKQKKEVEKIAKKYAGKPGAPGATGPAGPAGANGTNGKDGLNGTNGTNGAPGVPGEPGETGFTKFLPSGETETGDWSLNGNGSFHLASTGVSFNIPLESAPVAHYIDSEGKERVLNGETIEEVAQPECPGSATEPQANPGNLCVYNSQGLGTREFGWYQSGGEGTITPSVCAVGSLGLTACALQTSASPSADPTGFAVVGFTSEESAFAAGSWAVTAE